MRPLGADGLFSGSTGTPRAPRTEAVPSVPDVVAPHSGGAPAPPPRRRIAPQPSGRQRHDEKITVYVSAAELLALEQTRLVLRAEHGLSADRGRIVREAVAVLLADFEEYGEASTLVRRLSGD